MEGSCSIPVTSLAWLLAARSEQYSLHYFPFCACQRPSPRELSPAKEQQMKSKSTSRFLSRDTGPLESIGVSRLGRDHRLPTPALPMHQTAVKGFIAHSSSPYQSALWLQGRQPFRASLQQSLYFYFKSIWKLKIPLGTRPLWRQSQACHLAKQPCSIAGLDGSSTGIVFQPEQKQDAGSLPAAPQTSQAKHWFGPRAIHVVFVPSI